jgi:Flp pilus assembly protein TadD
VRLKPDYAEAWNNLGNARQALGEPHEAEACYLQAAELQPDWSSPRYNLGVALLAQGRLAEARAAGAIDEATTRLDEAAARADTGGWPFALVRYLRGELGGDELLGLAGDNDKKTEAHAYMGMDLLLKGEREAARAHFEWVRDYGNKRFFEYPLALAELKRLGG